MSIEDHLPAILPALGVSGLFALTFYPPFMAWTTRASWKPFLLFFLLVFGVLAALHPLGFSGLGQPFFAAAVVALLCAPFLVRLQHHSGAAARDLPPERLDVLSQYDPLTGLPNRLLLTELLEHGIRGELRERRKLAVLYIDLDRFKVINDTLGHRIGDAVLAQASARIRDQVRGSDLLARLGADEFIVVMTGMEDPADANRVAQKVIEALSRVFRIEGQELFVGASIGISLYPDDGNDAVDLVKAANIAMCHAKQQNTNGFLRFTKGLDAGSVERFALENDLRHALQRGQFILYYQPQVSVPEGRILGAEALIRWQHPSLGLVEPARFIPLAEEIGLILPIGEWVLREAARQTREWARRNAGLEWVSVNVSGVQILRSNFSDTVYGAIVESRCNPAMLELEITESTAMHGTEHINEVFERIRSLGVRLSIDDLGAGYSSLSRLRRLPLDKLKIDQAFIRELPCNRQDAAIARAILALGRSMDLEVIAEGVENREQMEILAGMGCRIAQGYYFGVPMPAQEFEALLLQGKQGGTAATGPARTDHG